MSTTNSLTIDNHSLNGDRPYPLNRDGSIMQRYDRDALLQRFPNLIIKDEGYWNGLNITVENEPPIDNWELVPVLKELYQDGLEITILTIPKGLTRKRIEEASKSEELISTTGFFRTLEDTPSKNTYRIVITNIPIAEKTAKDIKIGMPRIIEALALMRLGNNTASSVTRCCEKVWGVADSELAMRAVTVHKLTDNKIVIHAHGGFTPSTRAWAVYRLKSSEDINHEYQ